MSQTSDILADFRIYMEKKNMAANTIHVYLYAISQFLSLYRQVTPENLLLYKCYLLEHYKPQTANQRIRAMNCFLESHHMTSYHMTMIRIQQRSFLENVISQADYEYLKQCLLQDKNYTYYFMIRLMAATGMRVSELLQLQVSDIEQRYMDICSKGNKFRRIYIPKQVQEPCLVWLQSIERTTGPVFLNRYGNPISASGIRGQFKRFSARYGLDPAVVHPHAFRHLFAKNFIEGNGDIAMLSDILGHETLETTRIYLQRSSTEQKLLVNEIVDW